MGLRKIGFGRSCFQETLERLGILFRYVVGRAEVVQTFRVIGFESNGITESLDCLVVPTSFVKTGAEVVIRDSVIWFELDCLLKRFDRFREVAEPVVGVPQIAERTSVVRL